MSVSDVRIPKGTDESEINFQSLSTEVSNRFHGGGQWLILSQLRKEF